MLVAMLLRVQPGGPPHDIVPGEALIEPLPQPCHVLSDTLRGFPVTERVYAIDDRRVVSQPRSFGTAVDPTPDGLHCAVQVVEHYLLVS